MSISNILSTKKGKSSIIIILIILLLSGTIYYFMYGSEEAKYRSEIKKIISHIEKSNNEATSIYKYIENGKSSFDKIKTSLEDSKKEIETAYKLANEATVPNNNKLSHKSLINGINSNKLFIIQSVAILNNYTSTTVSSSINKLYEHLSTSVGYYEKFKLNNTTYTLPKDFLNFPDKFRIYINLLQKENGLNNSEDAYSSYIKDLRENLKQMDTISLNVNKEINLATSSSISPSQLMINLSKSKGEMSTIIDKINASLPPSPLKELQTLFISTGVAYEDYLSTLRGAIESSSKKDNNSIISSSISIASDSLNTYKQKYSSLISIINEKELEIR